MSKSKAVKLCFWDAQKKNVSLKVSEVPLLNRKDCEILFVFFFKKNQDVYHASGGRLIWLPKTKQPELQDSDSSHLLIV